MRPKPLWIHPAFNLKSMSVPCFFDSYILCFGGTQYADSLTWQNGIYNIISIKVNIKDIKAALGAGYTFYVDMGILYLDRKGKKPDVRIGKYKKRRAK